jgi:nicotinic acid phosphoribosyltransferase
MSTQLSAEERLVYGVYPQGLAHGYTVAEVYKDLIDLIEQVRQLREEINYLHRNGGSCTLADDEIVESIEKRLESILAEKTRGLNMKFVDAYLKEQAK